MHLHFHLYSLVICAAWLRQMFWASTRQPLQMIASSHVRSSIDFAHAMLASTVYMLERIYPMIEAVAPDKAPLVVGLMCGCNALALRVPVTG